MTNDDDVVPAQDAAIEQPAPIEASELVRRIRERATEAQQALARLLGDEAADPEELIHDYRVSLRRLRSILRLVEHPFGKKKVRALEDAIRAAASLTGDLRDEEVLRETLGDLKLDPASSEALAEWMRGRARRERGLRARVVRTIRQHATDGAGIVETLAKVHERLAGPPKDPSPDDVLAWAGISKAFEKVRQRAASDSLHEGHSEPMHRLRIGCKQLRYTTETVRGLVTPEGWEERTETLAAKLQKHLGRLHDFDEALVRMDRARGLDGHARHAVLAELAKHRKKTSARCVKEIDLAARELAVLLAPFHDPS